MLYWSLSLSLSYIFACLFSLFQLLNNKTVFFLLILFLTSLLLYALYMCEI